MLPLSLQYGYDTMEQFLKGAWSMDQHFANAPFEKNLPLTLGMLSVWNVSFLGLSGSRHFAVHAKRSPSSRRTFSKSPWNPTVRASPSTARRSITKPVRLTFGEPGTNGQHSFYQLIHQGRTIPCDFIGIIKSQQSVYLKGEIVSNHDELMCNFFAQADALAVGKSAIELESGILPGHAHPAQDFHR